MKIATATWPLDWHSRWNEYVGKLRVWIRTAKEQGADLLVFPEYGVMGLGGLSEDNTAGDVAASIDVVVGLIDEIDDLHASLAKEFEVHICAASVPVRLSDGTLVNRARLFSSDGGRDFQDKLIPTPNEREMWQIAPGAGVKVFDTDLGRMGILICYDSEFPVTARAMAAAGAEILIVPSLTSSIQGYWRVRTASMARALENQCVVVHASTIGRGVWMDAGTEAVGVGGVFAPPDGSFPDDGVISVGEQGEPGWTYAEVSLDDVKAVRQSGTVANFRHWLEQDARLENVEISNLHADQGQQI